MKAVKPDPDIESTKTEDDVNRVLRRMLNTPPKEHKPKKKEKKKER